jgi:UDP-glucuronate 4-epimerase
MLSDKKVLITGATGQIARPVAELLVNDNEVWCAARFTQPDARREVEALGIKTIQWDLASHDNSALPTDFTHVLHSAALMVTDDHEEAVRVNAEGAGLLMQHCRAAEAFIFVSTSGVYRRQEPDHAHKETDPLGGLATYASGYPIGKIASEGAVRAAALMLDLPTTIARMNIGYGKDSHGGLPVTFFGLMLEGKPIPVPVGYDNWGSPIGEDDIARQGAGPLFEIASVPATIVNWAGDDAISTRDFCDYLGGLAGLTPHYQETAVTFDSFVADNTRREALIGPCQAGWHEGMRRVIESRFPGAIPASPASNQSKGA